MGRYLIRPRAKLDLAEIVDYIAPRNADAAEAFLDATNEDFAFLADHPGSGTLRRRVPRHIRGLRSWPVSGYRNYLIFFLPTEDGIEIVRVLHGARRIGRALRES